MDQAEAIRKARQFADTAHSVEIDRISRQFQEKLVESRARLAARGIPMSGNAVSEAARINGERITALLQTRLDCLLEGFDLHGVIIDDSLVGRVIGELAALRSNWIKSAGQAYGIDPMLGRRLVTESVYLQMVEQ